LKKIPPGVGPKHPQVVVLVGATGDLARRKLLPGLFHLSSAGYVTVEPGDYAVADNSAVVFIPAAAIERVLVAAERIAAREAAMAQALRNGKSVSSVMGAAYETLLTGD